MTDEEHILISALRYALGRHTYITSVTSKYILSKLPILSTKALTVMLKDCIPYQNEDSYDAQHWKILILEIHNELKKRQDKDVSQVS